MQTDNEVDTVRLRVLTVTGKTIAISVPLGNEGLESIHDRLRSIGLDEADLEGVIISPGESDVTTKSSKPNIAAFEATDQKESTARAAATNIPYPKPQNPFDVLPATSERILIIKNRVPDLFVFAKDFGAYIPVKGMIADNGVAKFYIDPSTPFPPNASLALWCYWQQTFSRKVNDGQTITEKVTHTYGVSKTDSNELSMELGISAGGLSAKVSETLSQSVTISETTTRETDYTWAAKEGEVAIYTGWQYVEELQIVDEAGKIIHWSGTVAFDPCMPVEGALVFKSAANFPSGLLVNKIDRTIVDRTTFQL